LVRHSILTEYGIEPKKVTVVGGGVNFPKLPELKRQDEKDNAPTVLFIGKEFYRKGGDLLLRAFAQARAWAPEARLLLLTQDTINGNLPLEGVEVIKPTWDRAFIASLYRQADLFVLPSRLETWGDVLLEAMAYELPCIGVAGEAMEEIIQDGRNGLIVPPNNVEALANALIRLLNDARLRYEWGQAARQCVEKKYTWDRVAERVAPIIEVAAARQSFSERKEICYSLSKLS
jgi:glycosyltransferase involved in cell wall biosynthesis